MPKSGFEADDADPRSYLPVPSLWRYFAVALRSSRSMLTLTVLVWTAASEGSAEVAHVELSDVSVGLVDDRFLC